MAVKKKKTKRKPLIHKLDAIVSLIVRLLGKCERCGNTETLQAAHIFSRSNYSVRWFFDNILCLCARCHFWAHQNPILFTEWVRNHLGEMKYQNLKLEAKRIVKRATYELQEMLERFKQEYKKKGGV